MKYIVITGGVISGLGKGITASSIGLLLKSQGTCVTAIKIDPYLNIDAGTMSPFEHGECYVLGDGGEVDLDIGNYERFLGVEFTKQHNITTGKIYNNVITKERNGEYLGKTVQTIPHIVDEIKNWIGRVAHTHINNKIPDVCIIEIGGTVGDNEIMPFIEAIRQMRMNKDNSFCFVHVSLIVNSGEYKTKPTQRSIGDLCRYGIFPDLLVIRVDKFMDSMFLEKLSSLSGISEQNIIQSVNVKNIYYVPDLFKGQHIIERISQVIQLDHTREYDLAAYYKIINYFNTPKVSYKLAIAGKYTGTPDTYLSIIRSIEHAAIYNDVDISIHWINTKELNEESVASLSEYDGFIIPGGFGKQGIQGKLLVAKYCRENKKPILGICLGFQIMVIDCFTTLGLQGSSTEFDSNTPNKIIDILPDQNGQLGGTMRLGNYDIALIPGSKVANLYGTTNVVERHRHRYEVTNDYVSTIEITGLVFSGSSIVNDNKLMEIVELRDHPFYIGCQCHPEFKTRYDNPHPLFRALINAMKK